MYASDATPHSSHSETNVAPRVLHHESKEGSNFSQMTTCDYSLAAQRDIYIVCVLLLIVAVLMIVRNWIVITKYRRKT